MQAKTKLIGERLGGEGLFFVCLTPRSMPSILRLLLPTDLNCNLELVSD